MGWRNGGLFILISLAILLGFFITTVSAASVPIDGICGSGERRCGPSENEICCNIYSQQCCIYGSNVDCCNTATSVCSHDLGCVPCDNDRVCEIWAGETPQDCSSDCAMNGIYTYITNSNAACTIYQPAGGCAGTCTDTDSISTNQCTVSITLTSVGLDDEGKVKIGGTEIWSYYGCTCACTKENSGDNTCAQTHYTNIPVTFTRGQSVTTYVYGYNDCKAEEDGGIFGAITANFRVKSIRCNSGYTCSAGHCVAIATCNNNGQCEPARGENSTNCPADCLQPEPHCGNGAVETGEQCDDGNTANNDGCSSLCTIESGWSCTGSPAVCNPICGDGLIVDAEQCDNGGSNTNTPCVPNYGGSCNYCDTSCVNHTVQGPYCGDGIKNGLEECDDGNTVGGDGCSSTCQIEPPGQPPVCGNNILESGEVCDLDQLGGLNPDCTLYDAYTSGTLTCKADCSNYNWDSCNPNVCGNGVVEGSEQCDDENLVNGDGCSSTCQTEAPTCELNSASWDVNETVEGNVVGLKVTTTSCQGQELSFEIKERDFLGTDDLVNINPANVFVASDGTGVSSWTAEWRDDGPSLLEPFETNPPEYYFRVTLVSTGESIESSNQLEVLPDNYCIDNAIERCSSYTDSGYCENDICEVADDSNDECHLACKECSCSWDAETTKCISSVTSMVCQNVCGNGVLEEGEQCDDGNTVSGDGCSSTCIDEVPGAVCGNNILEGNEVCDGTQLSGLDPDCTLYDDFTSGTLTCEANCLNYNWDSCNPNVCGNGVLDGSEQCDDGNIVSGDGCSSTCIDEVPGAVCGNNILEGNEVCDGTQLSGLDPDCTLYDDFTSGTLTCEANCLNYNWNSCNSDGDGDKPDIGTCYYTENTADTCEDDGYLTVDLTARWEWDSECDASCQTENQGIAASCQSTTEVFQCPAQIPLPIFGFYNLLAALVLIAVIYLAISLRKKRKRAIRKK